MSAKAWRDVVPLLSTVHEVHAPTLLGHRGGPAASRRPATVSDIVDAAEAMLDDLALGRPHIAGNSLGGWVAIELARRGRAASVCALSPAGFWDQGGAGPEHGSSRLRRQAALVRFGRPVAPWMLRSRTVRRVSMRDIASHGDRLSAADALEAADDLLGCSIRDDILATTEQIAPLDPLPCPVTLAWSEADAIVPLATNGRLARARVPGASFVVLPGVGHVPMIDDPSLVARTILATTQDSSS
jgi:pimeloyl-ACP methyl ester carboxylesterase